MIRDRIKGMLLGAVIGDALGTPMEGMSGGHIGSVFGEISDYTDPEKGLKYHMERWKKPSLYSSLSQLMLLASFSPAGPGLLSINTVESIPPAENNEFGIFRHPGPALRDFIRNISRNNNGEPSAHDSPDTAPVTVLSPLPAGISPSDSLMIRRALTLTRNVHAVAGVLLISRLLRLWCGENSVGSFLDGAVQGAAETVAGLEAKSADIFSLSLNPDSLVEAAVDFQKILTAVDTAQSLDIAEKAIVDGANPRFKTPVSRATVNHPLLIIPLVLSSLDIYFDTPEKALYSIVSRGGAAAISGCLTGMIAGAARGTGWIPEHLLQGLVNRKTIVACTEAAADGRVIADPSVFIEGEFSLTVKESEEYRARLRHYTPRKKKPPKTRRDAERELSRHVVENWTKMDKAKWRKERERKDRKGE